MSAVDGADMTKPECRAMTPRMMLLLLLFQQLYFCHESLTRRAQEPVNVRNIPALSGLRVCDSRKTAEVSIGFNLLEWILFN